MGITKFQIDFVGVGVPRAGTSWLMNCLRRHPELGISEPKEIRYFNSKRLDLSSRKGAVANRNRDLPFSWYEKHFKHCLDKPIKGEFSPIYLSDEDSATNIKEALPDVKIIICLRNPVDRAFSHYWFLRGIGHIGNIPFEDALKVEKHLIEVGYYAKQLKRFFECFDAEQVLILFFDDVIEDPNREIGRVLEFLGASTIAGLSLLDEEKNHPRAYRYAFISRIYHFAPRILVRLKLGALVDCLRKRGVHRFLKNAVTHTIKPTPMSERTRKCLTDRFRESVIELEGLVDRDLSSWK